MKDRLAECKPDGVTVDEPGTEILTRFYKAVRRDSLWPSAMRGNGFAPRFGPHGSKFRTWRAAWTSKK
jgi:hypothetical protein